MHSSGEYICLFLTILLSLTVYRLIEDISSFAATDDSTMIVIDAVFVVIILSIFGMTLFLLKRKI